MTDHEFLTFIHHEFEANKDNDFRLGTLLVRLEERFDIPGLFELGYNRTLLRSDLRALRLYQKISEVLQKRH